MASASVSAAPTLYSVSSNGNDHLYRIDAMTGVATDLGLIAFGDAEGLAFANSSLYAIGGSVPEFWNITTPPGILVGSTGPRNGIDAGLDFNVASGVMYNMNSDIGLGSLYTINLATGAATLVGSDKVFIDGFAIDASGNAFGIDGAFSDSLYSVNLATGAATLIGSLGIGIDDQFGLAFTEGTLYGISDSGDIYTLNTATGAATLLSSTTCGGLACSGWEGLAAQQQQVPEPGTLALFGLALLGLVYGQSSRRRYSLVNT
jgi:hypothetical protein